jgi:hypothetical protein
MRCLVPGLLSLLAIAAPLSAATPAPRAPVVEPTILTPAQANAAFALMAAQKDIAFTYPQDGCYSRAHLMVHRLQCLGYRPGKVWAFANGARLHARTPHDLRGFIEWGWHVAPTLPVRTADGGVRDLVIDPSLFTRPVTVERWRDSMRKSPTSPLPFTCQTSVGEPPLRPNGSRPPGTGYWNYGDPAGDLDLHAQGVMRRYQSIADAR